MADHALQAADAAFHPVLTVIDGEPFTTSLDVAAFFGRRHSQVLRDVDLVVERLPAERRNIFVVTFRDIPGPNGSTRQERCYRLAFDGFVLLVMGFTGAEAMVLKVRYMDEFNRMKAALSQRQSEQARLALRASDERADALAADLNRVKDALIDSQAGQIKLLNRIASIQYRHSRREAVRLAVDMERRGEPRDRIQAATGLNGNYLRQVVFRARAAGDLPPAVGLADHLAAQAAAAGQQQLDLGGGHA